MVNRDIRQLDDFLVKEEYHAHSGVDIQAAMYLPLIYRRTYLNRTKVPSKQFKLFATLQTISISSTRSISPVRVLGQSNPVKYLKGARCLPASELVYVKGKGRVSIAKIEPGDYVQSSPTDFNKVVATTNDGLKKCYKIDTLCGHSITASYDHPIMSDKGWKKPEDIKVGDRLYVSCKSPIYGEGLPIDDGMLTLIAYLLGDGHMGMHTHSTPGKFSHTIILTISDKKMDTIGRESAEILEKFNIPYTDRRNEKFKCIERRISICFTGTGRTAPKNRVYNGLHTTLKELNLYRKKSEQKFLPESFLDSLSESQICLFLNRLFSTDGWYSFRKARIEAVYSSTSIQLIDQVRFLLTKLGIPSSVQLSRKKGQVGGTIGKRQIVSRRDLYKLIISDNYDLYRFINKVGIFSQQHEITEEVNDKIKSSISHTDLSVDTKEFNAIIQNMLLEHKIDKATIPFTRSRPTSIKKALAIKELIPVPEIKAKIDEYVDNTLANPDEYKELKVTEVTEVGELEVYDIEVEDRHEFICNYFKVHNTFAGTMVFAAIESDPFSEIYDVGLEESYINAQTSIISDQLPPFSVIVTAANEMGGVSMQAIHGITLVNMGTTYSVDDLYSEIVYSYVATDVTQLSVDTFNSRRTAIDKLADVGVGLANGVKSASTLIGESLISAYSYLYPNTTSDGTTREGIQRDGLSPSL